MILNKTEVNFGYGSLAMAMGDSENAPGVLGIASIPSDMALNPGDKIPEGTERNYNVLLTFQDVTDVDRLMEALKDLRTTMELKKTAKEIKMKLDPEDGWSKEDGD